MLEYLKKHWGLFDVTGITKSKLIADLRILIREIADRKFVRINCRLVCKFLSYQYVYLIYAILL